MNIQYNSLTQCSVEFLHWVIPVIRNLSHSFNKFLYYNQKNLWLAPFLQVKVSAVSPAGDSFCWKYATDTFYSIASNYIGATICCNCACFELLLQLCRRLFLFQRNFCKIYAGESFCNKYMGNNFLWNYPCGSLFQSWRWYFQQCIKHMIISIVIMQATVSVIAVCDSSKSQLYYFFLWYPIFITFTRKHQKVEDIKSNLNFATLVNIPPKLRYFVCG